MVDRRQLTRLEQKMSSDVRTILEVLGQQQQQRQQPPPVSGRVRPRMSDVGVNTGP